ncbi:MAG: hypothetical protein ACHQVK_00965, partial [Candidatus Paceibacterales bacterium]
NDEAPLVAGNQVSLLGQELLNKRLSAPLTLPALVIYSEDDNTINLDDLLTIAVNNFSNAEILPIPKNERVPHQIIIPEINPHSSAVINKTISFINQY